MTILRITGLVAGENYSFSLSNGASSDTISGTWLTAPAAPVPTDINIPSDVEGRITLVQPVADLSTLNSVVITTQPTNGRLTVNPDLSLSWNLTYYAGTAADSYAYEYDLSTDIGVMIPVTVTVPAIVESPLIGNWPSGRSYYFEVDSDLSSVIEPGANHRKIHAATDGLTADDIVALEAGLSDPSQVTAAWLATNTASGETVKYGETEALALVTSLATGVWYNLHPENSTGTSDWLLLKRGQHHGNIGRVFQRGVKGESAMHPLVLGAWGTGTKPKVSGTAIGVSGYYSKNIVMRDIYLDDNRFNFTGEDGLEVSGSRAENMLVEMMDVHGGETESVFTKIDGGCMRYNRHIRQIESVPAGIGGYAGWWDRHNNRVSSIFMDEFTDYFIEGVQAYHAGWADDFSPFSRSELGGHSPGYESQGFYIQKRGWGLIMKDCVSTHAAGNGCQARSGAVIINMLLADNNQQGFTGFGNKNAALAGGLLFAGSWSMWDGAVVTSAAYKEAFSPKGTYRDPDTWSGTSDLFDNPVKTAYWSSISGAKAFALKAEDQADPTRDTYQVFDTCIVTHKADPDSAAEIALKTEPGKAYNPATNANGKSFAFHNSKSYRWDHNDTSFNDLNLDGLDTAVLDVTTFQRYVAAHGTLVGSTIQDWAEYYALIDTATGQAAEHKAVMNYFRTGFGDALMGARTTPQTVNFQANPITDGVQWMYRRNWDTVDVPIDGDSIALNGCWTTCANLTRTVAGLDFGAGGKLTLLNGHLEHTGTMAVGTGGAELNIDYIGRFVSAGYSDSDLLTINQTGGRFLNTGTFAGNCDVNISDGQFIFADAGAVLTLGDGNTMTIMGAPKVGFDGTAGGTAMVTINGALAFVATGGVIGQIREFHSGRNGTAAPNVTSVVNLASGTLDLNLAGMTAASHSLIDVDTLTGTFGALNVSGLDATLDATVTVDASAGEVTLTLAVGSGTSALVTI